MKTTFYFLCFFCFLQLFLSGCESKDVPHNNSENNTFIDKTPQLPFSDEAPALSLEDQAKLDKNLERFGKEKILSLFLSGMPVKRWDEEYVLKQVKYLVSQGAHVNGRAGILPAGDKPPIIFALRNKFFNVADYLISHGADLTFINDTIIDTGPLQGFTLLQQAVDSEDIELVRFLVSNGADVNANTDFKRSDGFNFTTLDIAKKTGNTEIVEYLISVGAK
ncbi:MAG: ankyrin repeat domain-containing protein [Planctomycetaceae bacterium]|nr:ankyrin repeat domain-containing protein [Planctomycetaceae bacterium]